MAKKIKAASYHFQGKVSVPMKRGGECPMYILYNVSEGVPEDLVASFDFKGDHTHLVEWEGFCEAVSNHFTGECVSSRDAQAEEMYEAKREREAMELERW